LPLFGNLKHIQELMLEKGHQQAKRSLKMSNQKNPQLQAMNDALVEDLLCRLKSLTSNLRVHGKFSAEQKETIRLLFGLDINIDDSSIKDAFSDDVLFVLDSISFPLVNRDENPYWLCPKGKIQYENEHELHLKYISSELCNLVERNTSRKGLKSQIHSICRKYHAYGEEKDYERKEEICAFEVINLLTILGEKDTESIPSVEIRNHSDSGESTHFLCLAFISVKDDDKVVDKSFAICASMKKEYKTYLEKEEIVYTSDLLFNIVIPMDPNVRKSHAIHACWLREQCENRNGVIFHSECLMNGGSFILNTNKEGYPPRRG